MLPAATERILATVPDDALVLDIGGWAAPFNRADWMLDLMPYDTRGAMGSYGPKRERFTARTWVERDICDHKPWPFADKQFDFTICVTTLEDIRDPIWVCSEMARVSKAGYIEVPTVQAELIYNVEGDGPYLGHDHHRWFVQMQGGELVFTHKMHSIHHDWKLRVLPRWREQMTLEDHLQGMFWTDALPARERFMIGTADYDEVRQELQAILQQTFEPSSAEIAVKQARELLAHRINLAKRPVRKLAEQALGRITKR
jgi:hypothetical protein